MNYLRRIAYILVTERPGRRGLLLRATNVHNEKDYHSIPFRITEAILFFSRQAFRPLTITLLKLAYAKTGLHPIGFGYFSTAVITADGEVKKYYEFTAGFSPDDLSPLIRSLEDRLDIAKTYLADSVVATRVAIENHPITNKSCVVLSQPLAHGVPLIKRPYSTNMNSQQTINYKAMLLAAESLQASTGYLLDLNSRNLFLTNDRVVIVDTILMGRIDAIMYPRTLQILNDELASLANI